MNFDRLKELLLERLPFAEVNRRLDALEKRRRVSRSALARVEALELRCDDLHTRLAKLEPPPF